MLHLYMEDKISEVSHGVCLGLKQEEWNGVSSKESESVRAGFPIHLSSIPHQQRRQQKQKQWSHLWPTSASGFLCLLSFLSNMQSISPRRPFLSRYFPLKHLSGKNSWSQPQRDIREKTAVAEDVGARSSLNADLGLHLGKSSGFWQKHSLFCFLSFHNIDNYRFKGNPGSYFAQSVNIFI